MSKNRAFFYALLQLFFQIVDFLSFIANPLFESYNVISIYIIFLLLLPFQFNNHLMKHLFPLLFKLEIVLFLQKFCVVSEVSLSPLPQFCYQMDQHVWA